MWEFVSHLYLPSLRLHHPGPDGDVELPPGDGLDPDVVALKAKEKGHGVDVELFFCLDIF